MDTFQKIIRTTLAFSFLLFWISLNVIAQKLPEQYREDFSESFQYRKTQHLEIKAYVDELNQESVKESLKPIEPDFFSLSDYENSLYPYRERLSKFYGYPPPESKTGTISKFEKVGEDVYCTIYRVWVEVISGVDAYGIYMVPKKIKGKAPLIIAQHGGGGNPEAICDLDTRVNYKSFGHEAVKRGYLVWAPALTMTCGYCDDPEITETTRNALDRQLRFQGSTIVGVELQQIIESTKTLIRNRPEIDADRVGMTGLSWGGFYTTHVAALWPHIKVAIPSGSTADYEVRIQKAVSGESKSVRISSKLFDGLGISQVIGLICPRPCMIQHGIVDPVVDIEGARVEVERAKYYYEKLGIEDRFEFMEHPEGHVFENQSIFKFFEKHL